MKVLAGSIALMAVLAAYRFYSYWTTGFFVTDEYGYYFDAVHGRIYGDRWFFGWMNILLFRVFGIKSPDAFSYFMPFFIFFWAALTLVVFYKVLKLLGFDEKVTSLSLASCFILISFVLLSLGFLTEPVGLGLAMVGIYFLVRYMKSERLGSRLSFTFLSAIFFGLAAGAREPYNAFLIGGIPIVFVLAWGTRGKAPKSHGTRTVVALSVLTFLATSAFFLFVPTQAYSQQVAPISGQLADTIVSNPVTPGATTTTTATVTSTMIGTTSSLVSVNGTTTTTTFTTTLTTTTTSVGLSKVSYPFYRDLVASNTLLIFFGGILLGWGPVCFGIGLAGILILVKRVTKKRDPTAQFLLLTSLVALGSYFIVAFISAGDPTYFSFQNYSTIIRFSDTALPAYFLVVPLVMRHLASSRRRVAGLVIVSVSFVLVFLPIYQVFATSNLTVVGNANPFVPGYRTPAAAIRGYFAAEPSNRSYLVAGLPYGWTFTPGVQDLRSVKVYSLANNGQSLYLNSSTFLSLHWDAFYIYSQTPASPAQSLPPFLGVPLENGSSSAYPYAFSNSQVVAKGSDYALLFVTVSWR